MPDRFVLVLAGGRGERFWPWSRPERPKQLLPLAPGGRSLLAATLERALRLTDPQRVLVLTARDLVSAVRDECPPGVLVVGEPVGRNTAPAIGAAAAWALGHSPQATLAVMPSDHLITRTDAFTADAGRAFALAAAEPVLVTFGIRPTHPETNFGYLQCGAPLADGLHQVARFTEKPDRDTAVRWVADGTHLWNSGIFVWGAATFLHGLEASRPALAAPLRALGAPATAAAFEAALARVFPDLESISVDYAVLEHAPNVVTLSASFDWDDLGSWSAWARTQPRDDRGNVAFGEALVFDCERCVVVGEGGPAAALGLRDMIVVHANGSTLAVPLDRSEQVRQVSEAARQRAAGAGKVRS
jgi:mannose-1-phosphate guanylyltransferase